MNFNMNISKLDIVCVFPTLNCQKYALNKPLALFELKLYFLNLFLKHANFLIHFCFICRSYRTCNGTHPRSAQLDHLEKTVSVSIYYILNNGI